MKVFMKKIKHRQFILKVVSVGLLLMLYHHAYADGVDLLAGTSDDLVATINGVGKKYIYLTEGLLALFGFMKTRNPIVLTGIVAIAVFLNIMLKIATG